MARVFYGVWNGEVFDNRDKIPIDIPEIDFLKNVDFFNDGNPIQAFIGVKGFLVFDMSVNLLDAFWRHMRKAATESCGKCTPCRMGSRTIVKLLDDLRQGKGTEKTWNEVYALAKQMRAASLCGMGKTSPMALLGALDNFKDKLVEDSKVHVKTEQHGMTYMTAPCIEACPAKVNVPRYIDYIKDGRHTHALGVVLQKYPLAATCGRVCVGFCEKACRRNLIDKPVGIKILKRFIADCQTEKYNKMFTKSMCAEPLTKPPLKVAVVGAGAAGVSCAYHLLLKGGYHVDVFESHPEAGGMAVQGIPSYRLPRDVLSSELDIVNSLGGHFLFNKSLGKDFTIDDLFKQGYRSVFLAMGCRKGTPLGIKNENPYMDGYLSGVKFLLQVHKHTEEIEAMTLEGQKVAIVGGGNVAMDCARSSVRLGADEVHVFYRRTREDMPADPAEIKAAEEEGVIFHFLTNPISVISKDEQKLDGIEVVNMQQGEPDASGRRGVSAIAGSEREFICDTLIAAVGQQIDANVLHADDSVELNKYGCIKNNSVTYETTRKGVFAGGDCTLGPATLIDAMADGMNAAYAIDDYLRHGKVQFSPLYRMRQIINENKLLEMKKMYAPMRIKDRVEHTDLDPDYRKNVFDEVEQQITCDQAYQESKRCMRCYTVFSVITQTPVIGVFEEHLEKYERSVQKDC